jgi:hypothetical protein
MAERRTLIEGIKSPPPTVSPHVEQDFVYREKTASPQTSPAAAPGKRPTAVPIARVPISTRIRAEFAQALKRASLERQLGGTEPNTLQDILEEAVEPWLRSNGYLSP